MGKLLAVSPDSCGYLAIGTTGGPKRVHVLVAEAFLGQIPKGGEVHHRNENRADARASNLEIRRSRLAHGERHRRVRLDRRREGEENPRILCACGCGRTFLKFDSGGRPRRYVTGHNTAERNRRGVVGSRG